MFAKIVENSHLKLLLCVSLPCLAYGLMLASKISSRRANRMELSLRRASVGGLLSTAVLLCWFSRLKEPMIDLAGYMVTLYTLIRVGTGISDVIIEPTPRNASRKSVLRLIGGHLLVMSVLSLILVYERLDPSVLARPVMGHLLRFLRAKYEVVSLVGFVYLLLCAGISGAAGALVHSKMLPVEGVSDWITNVTVLELATMMGLQIALASNIYSPGTFTS